MRGVMYLPSATQADLGGDWAKLGVVEGTGKLPTQVPSERTGEISDHQFERTSGQRAVAAYRALRVLDLAMRAADRGGFGARVKLSTTGLAELAEAIRPANPELARELEATGAASTRAVEAAVTKKATLNQALSNTTPQLEAMNDAVYAARRALFSARSTLRGQLGANSIELAPKSDALTQRLLAADDAYRIAAGGAASYADCFTERGGRKELTSAAQKMAERLESTWPEVAQDLRSAIQDAASAARAKDGSTILRGAFERALVGVQADLPKDLPGFAALAFV